MVPLTHLTAGSAARRRPRTAGAAPQAELVTHGSVAWAAAVLLSRSFSLDLSEEEPLEGDMGYIGTWTSHPPDVLALVPWADCLTHCSLAGGWVRK